MSRRVVRKGDGTGPTLVNADDETRDEPVVEAATSAPGEKRSVPSKPRKKATKKKAGGDGAGK